MKKLNVALIQADLIWENRKANIQEFDNKLSTLKSDLDLIIFPEMFSTGFSMNTSLAEEMSGPTVSWMKLNAKAFRCYIAGSLIIKERNKIHNRLLFVSPDGEITFYDKRHLFSMAGEDKHFDAGDSKSVVEIKGIRINLMVCYDLRFPVWSRNKYAHGKYDYDAIIYVANWPAVRSQVWRNLLQARAAENMAFVIGVNRVGADGNGIEYNGDSMVIDPWGSIVVQSEIAQEQILYTSLDIEILAAARSKFPVANDADDFNLLG